MDVWPLSSLIFLIAIGAILSLRQGFTVDIAQDYSDSDITIAAETNIEDKITLEDSPPPDDTYTPDQRRYS